MEDVIIELKYIRDIVPYENPPEVILTAEELEDLKYKFDAKTINEKGIDFLFVGHVAQPKRVYSRCCHGQKRHTGKEIHRRRTR